MADYFNEREPTPGQNSNKWWGNSRERKRHQEYFAWRQGGHANSLKSLNEGYDGRYVECLPCHAAEATPAGGSDALTLDEAQHGITCAVCHNAHGDLYKLRMTCDACHGEGAFFHRPKGRLFRLLAVT